MLVSVSQDQTPSYYLSNEEKFEKMFVLRVSKGLTKSGHKIAILYPNMVTLRILVYISAYSFFCTEGRLLFTRDLAILLNIF